MPEWLQSWQLANVQLAVDLMAAAVFAVTGALVASGKQMDIVGFSGGWRKESEAARYAICWCDERLSSGSAIRTRDCLSCGVISLVLRSPSSFLRYEPSCG